MHVTNVFQESEKMADSKKNSTAREQGVLKIQNSGGVFGKNEIIYENFSRKRKKWHENKSLGTSISY